MTSKRKITWEHFRDAAQRDRKAWQVLLECGINDLAAYHMQQCVEKYLKAVILKYRLLDMPPKTLGHTPLIAIFKKIEELMIIDFIYHPDKTRKTFKFFDSPAAIHKNFELFIDAKREIMYTNKHLLWKQSLGIDLTKDEITKINGPKTLKLLQYNNTSTDQSILKFAEMSIEDQTFKSKYTASSRSNAMLWIVSRQWIPIYMSPHMEIGRYPEIIDGKLSTDMYNDLPTVLHLAERADLFHEDAEEILTWTDSNVSD